MTDNDKKRIEEEAFKTTLPIDKRDMPVSLLESSLISAFKSGAHYEHPIAHKEGWNEAIDYILKNYNKAFYNASYFRDLKK